MSEVKVTILDNGPFLVKGSIELMDAGGNQVATQGDQVALCRCGASVKKPFCDGTHSKVGFEAAERAVREQ
jgi:CDGSH-type Zn-finger protein